MLCLAAAWCRLTWRCPCGVFRILALAGCVARVRQRPVCAQQTVDYASVSGRVTDPSGAVVPGATRDRAPHADERRRDGGHRPGRPVPVPVPASRALRDRRRVRGFSDATRRLDADGGRGVRAADRRWPSAGVDASVTVTAEATVLEAARSQIAGTVSQTEVAEPADERPQLPRPRAARARRRRRPTSPARSSFPRRRRCPASASRSAASAISRTTSSSTACRPTTMRPALSGITYGVDAIEQFQVVTSGGQAELGRALGGYVNVVTRSGTNTLRGTVYDYVRDDRLNAGNALSGHHAADEPVAVRRQPRRPGRDGPDVLLRQRRAARARPDRADDDLAGRTSRVDQRAAARPSATGPAGRDRHLPEPGRHDQRARPRSITRSAAAISSASATASTTSASQNSRGAGGLSAPSASSDLDNPDQTVAVEQHADRCRRAPCSRRARSSRTATCRRRRPIRSARP